MSIDVTTLAPVRWLLFRGIRLESLAYDPVFERNYREETAWEEAFWRENIRYGVFALAGDKPVSLVLYSMLDDPDGEACAKIYGLYVNPAFRRQGIAGRLFERILTLITKQETVNRIILAVNADLEHAVRLYRRHGFRAFTAPGTAGPSVPGTTELTMETFL